MEVFSSHNFVVTLSRKRFFERWEDALCESMVVGSKDLYLYCPFKECSAMLVDDGGEVVTMSECPNVAWHDGSDYDAFQIMRRNVGSERADNMVMELAQKKNWRRCPGCKFFVEKNEGCMHITCRSAFSFVYLN